MTDKLSEYIQQNQLCTEGIFRNWEEFLKLLYESGGRVEAILWFDYCKIEEQTSSLGCGGYRDVQNEGYM